MIGYARAEKVGPRAAFGLLEPFKAIGALVPDLSPEDIAGLPEKVPDSWDVAALAPRNRISPPGAPLVPLDLVSVACRLGEPLDRAWQRMAPYWALQVSADSSEPFAKVPQILPLWQDLAILSVGLDGMLPAITGLVTPKRLAFSADGVGETPAWVRDRLAHYAELFGLDLPEPAVADALRPVIDLDGEVERP
ncbi:hypothetical protein [Kitasatospora sp. NPDC057541]|uniref:wHTH domain-containing protein n=1 Tax=unclassified Kitasatospora TaxID=2633591 RepID=UPI0036B18F76